RIVRKCRYDCRVHSEASFERASDVVLAATFVGVERAGCPDPFIAWVETEHNFAQSDEIPAAFILCFDLHGAKLPSSTGFSFGERTCSAASAIRYAEPASRKTGV